MKHTTLDRTSADATGDSAVPYEDHSGSNVAVPQIGDGPTGAAGGIWSNADEMSRWVLARLEVPLATRSFVVSRDAARTGGS